MVDKILEGLDSVTFYNGLAEEVARWKDLEPNDYNSISAPDNIVIPKTEDDYQLQVIWIILVELFGDCGTSPRSGWLYTANKEEINKFIDRITYTWYDRSKGDYIQNEELVKRISETLREEIDI